MDINPPVKTFYATRERMKQHYAMSHSWRKTGAKFGISAPMARLIVLNGHYPKDKSILDALGLPELGTGIVCPVHHVVHSKQCRRMSIEGKAISDIPVNALKWMIDNRSEIK